MHALAFAIALLAQTTPTAGSSPQANAAATTSAQTADSDPTVCRSVTETGSRFTHKECHTASEWRALADEAQRQVQQDQRLSSGSSNGPH